MSNVATLSTSTDWPEEAIPQQWIEKLFEEMLFTYGKKFSDQWAGADPRKLKMHWARKMFSLTNEEMRRGVEAMRKKDWPPTLNEFMSLCKPPIDSTVAYYEAIEGLAERERGNIGTWSHPAIFWASAKMASDLKSLTYSGIKARWEKALTEEIEKGKWAEIPKPTIALPAPGKAELSKEQATKMLSQLGASGILKKSGNPKRWAKRILERVAAGEVMPDVSVRFAREALAASDA